MPGTIVARRGLLLLLTFAESVRRAQVNSSGLIETMIPPSDRFTVRIADLSVSLDLAGCDHATQARLFDRYAAFVVPALHAGLSIRVRTEPGPEFVPLSIATTWQIRTDEHNGLIRFESYDEKGWVDRIKGQGELVMRPQGDPENYLRVLFSWMCLEQQGLLLHACGVISNGKGFVFFGPSGSGKTTVARLSLDRTVLSDDLVIIKKSGSVFRLYGVPFRGDFPEAPRHNASAGLHGIYVLVKDRQHYLTPVLLPEAIARLTACVPFVMAQPGVAQRVSETCLAVATQVQVQALHFRIDPGFWEVIDGFH